MFSRSTTGQEVNEILDSVLSGIGSFARISALGELPRLRGVLLVRNLLVLDGKNASDRAEDLSETHCCGKHNVQG